MQTYPISTLTEADIDGIVFAAGGRRAHEDATRREDIGADYLIGETLIELKMLDEEGFDKAGRQAKLAALFRPSQPHRPVVVLDPALLAEADQRRYRGIVEQPIKTMIAKSRKQLAQSRAEIPEATRSVLWIVNNSYTALDDETIKALAANRVRQDTSSIDGIIVSGVYYHSDGFDTAFLWPCSYVPVHVDAPFTEFESLHRAFHDFANRFMTDFVRSQKPTGSKYEVRDLVFDVDGVRYVRPAPVLGMPSEFYVNGRPRANEMAPDDCPPVARVVARLARGDQEIIAAVCDEAAGPLADWEAWQRYLADAETATDAVKPLVAMQIDREDWLAWCRTKSLAPGLPSLNRFALGLFHDRMLALLSCAAAQGESSIVPSSYILVVTQEIGQDCLNDVSDITQVRERPGGDPLIRPLAENLRIPHMHALALAASYALRENLDVVRWRRDDRYAWV